MEHKFGICESDTYFDYMPITSYNLINLSYCFDLEDLAR